MSFARKRRLLEILVAREMEKRAATGGTVYDFQLLGGAVDPARAWVNERGNNDFNEVGDGTWRVSFRPTFPMKIMVMALLSKHRMGEGGPHSRLYSKGRIVQHAPVLNPNLASYCEAIWESTEGSIRFLDCPMVLLAPLDIRQEAVGLPHTFAAEQLAGDGVRGEVCFGAPMMIFG